MRKLILVSACGQQRKQRLVNVPVHVFEYICTCTLTLRDAFAEGAPVWAARFPVVGADTAGVLTFRLKTRARILITATTAVRNSLASVASIVAIFTVRCAVAATDEFAAAGLVGLHACMRGAQC